ncbi:MAG TPA: prepilin-type N-terminal cleavage/methylation domain-containing protein [Sandaracinaceae bacterium LLY-WYZ-13_1]|nr:prepilin-type N-terminal cleavage/methylation domain-containing protein [Sandaracinaceae bacterium LLY-WYZ-13_1]
MAPLARRIRRARTGGYTLLELMIVVVLIGVLSAIAIPSFQSYLYRSRTAEAVTFLGEIRQRQESYRAEFGQYCSVSGAPGASPDSGAWAPGSLPASGTSVGWPGAPGAWSQLGAVPDGPVRFQYRTTAGPPGTTPGITGYDGSDFWFVAQARADLDGDGEVMIIEAYSASNHLYFADGAMAPLSSGYE